MMRISFKECFAALEVLFDPNIISLGMWLLINWLRKSMVIKPKKGLN